MQSSSYDVAILGGGLAGNVLARHLRRQLPGLAIGVFERSAETSYKVGESTVELFSNYMLRRLGLSTYLYENHLPKNGLRFFFDTPDRSAPLQSMSEIGSRSLPYHPSFQVDRRRLEADLRQMNAAAGIDVQIGVVHDLVLGEGGEAHRFTVRTADGRVGSHRARWVIDATGRTSLIAKQKKLRVARKDHTIAAAWARYGNVVDMDDLPGAEFAKRVRHTSRRLSTTHFCYPGYWIWFIPLGRGVVSVGAVIDRACRAFDPAIQRPPGLAAFLDEHAAVRGLLRGAEVMDFGAYGQLAYGTTRFFDAGSRWGLIGEAAAFTDPFYSPGSDFIALEGDFLTDLVARDVAGAGTGELAELGELYDEYMRYRYEANLLLYAGQYGLLGSFDLLRLKWELDMSCYYELWVDAYMQDHHLDADRLRQDLRQRTFVLTALDRFRKLFADVSAKLVADDRYHANNLGRFAEGLDFIADVPGVGRPRTDTEVQSRVLTCFNSIRRQAFAHLGANPGDADAAPSFADFVTGRAFVGAGT